MVTVLLFSLIAGGLYSVVLVGNSAWQNFQSVIVLQQDVRRAVAMLVRDLRPAENLNVQQGERQILISFRHPVHGDMSYDWSAKGTAVGALLRHTAEGERPIAQNISKINITPEKNAVLIAVAGSTIARDGKPIDFALHQRVTLRR
jgi:hypothetical protein